MAKDDRLRRLHAGFLKGLDKPDYVAAADALSEALAILGQESETGRDLSPGGHSWVFGYQAELVAIIAAPGGLVPETEAALRLLPALNFEVDLPRRARGVEAMVALRSQLAVDGSIDIADFRRQWRVRYGSTRALVSRLVRSGEAYELDGRLFIGADPSPSEADEAETVPILETSYGSREGRLKPDQKAYFEWFCGELEAGRYPEIGKNTTYVFLAGVRSVRYYLRNRVAHVEDALERLASLSMHYRQPRGGSTIGWHLDDWRADILLIEGRKVEAWSVIRETRADAERLLTFAGSDYRMDADDVAPYARLRGGMTDYGIRAWTETSTFLDRRLNAIYDAAGMNLAAYLRKQFTRTTRAGILAERVANDLDVPQEVLAKPLRRDWHLPDHMWARSDLRHAFASIPPGNGLRVKQRMLASVPRVHLARAVTETYAAVCTALARAAEEDQRRVTGKPAIGLGWISEIELLDLVREKFAGIAIVHQGSPLWLGQQRFDIYLPEYNLAIEYQGAQHFDPVDRFGGLEGLKATQARDERKRALSRENGCVLIEVLPDYEREEVVARIGAAITLATGTH